MDSAHTRHCTPLFIRTSNAWPEAYRLQVVDFMAAFAKLGLDLCQKVKLPQTRLRD